MNVFPGLQLALPQVDLQEVMDHLRHDAGRRTYPLWQDDCLCFVGGHEYRSEFHSNPSFEMQYSLKGPLNPHWRDNFFDSVDFRTCRKCGTVMPAPGEAGA